MDGNNIKQHRQALSRSVGGDGSGRGIHSYRQYDSVRTFPLSLLAGSVRLKSKRASGWHTKPVGEISKVPASPARSVQGSFSVARPRNLQDERAIEMQIVEMR